MSYFLNKEEILELLTIQNLNNSEETSKYNENKLYEFYLKYIESKGIVFDREKMPKNHTRQYQYYDENDPNSVDAWYLTSQLSDELATQLDGKIPLFSDSFWLLFDYSKCNNENDWKRPNPYTHLNFLKEDKFEIKGKVNFLKKYKGNDLLDSLTDYLENVNFMNENFVVLWSELALLKEHENKFKNDEPFSFIDRFNCITQKDKYKILKCKLISLFKPETALLWLTEMYNLHKGSAVNEKIAEIVKQFNPDLKENKINIFEECHEVIYQNTINIDPNALMQKSNPTTINNFFKVFNYIINNFNNQGHRIEVDLHHKQFSYQYQQYRDFKKFVIKAYSAEHLEQEEKQFKNLFNVSWDIISSQKKMLTEKEMENTLNPNNMDLLIKEIHSHIKYLLLDKKVNQILSQENLDNEKNKKEPQRKKI